MRILTSDEVRQARAAACNRAGVTSLKLAHSAGYAVTQFCLAQFKFASVCVVCGKDATGAIGLVAAESLRTISTQVSVIVLAGSASELQAEAAEVHRDSEPLWISSEADFQSSAAQQALAAELIIDAIAGADGKRPLENLERAAVAAINNAFGTVVSVDLPSGADPDSHTAVHTADSEIVFCHGVIGLVAPRPAHIFGELTSGPMAISEIGVQPVAVSHEAALQVTTGQEVAMAFPPRPNEAHKGDFGHVLVIGGSHGKAGAAALAGLGALRAGAGLVTVACPQSIQATVSGFAPELMTEALPETAAGSVAAGAGEALERILPGKDVVVLGPGLSHDPETAAFVRAFVARCPAPLVLDADGLNVFQDAVGEIKPRAANAPFRVLTPHSGEAARLLGATAVEIQKDRLASARRLASEASACIVLKGWHTVIAGASGENWINLTGNPALAKGGSGDVLSGMIAAALARRCTSENNKLNPAEVPVTAAPERARSWVEEISGINPAEKIARHRAGELQRTARQSASFLCDAAVAAAVHLHGLAGDIARDRMHENTVLARDVMANLSEPFHECELQMEQRLFYLQK